MKTAQIKRKHREKCISYNQNDVIAKGAHIQTIKWIWKERFLGVKQYAQKTMKVDDDV